MFSISAPPCAITSDCNQLTSPTGGSWISNKCLAVRGQRMAKTTHSLSTIAKKARRWWKDWARSRAKEKRLSRLPRAWQELDRHCRDVHGECGAKDIVVKAVQDNTKVFVWLRKFIRVMRYRKELPKACKRGLKGRRIDAITRSQILKPESTPDYSLTNPPSC